MEIIKRYYEKLILLASLLVFIIAMIFVLVIDADTHEISDDKLELPKFKADYVAAQPGDPKLNIQSEVSRTGMIWEKSAVRDAAHHSNHSSDLVMFPGIARCPDLKCNKLIPVHYFSGKECPECGFALPVPERPSRKLRVASDDDRDGDGISDELEDKYGMDKSNPADALLDNDNDGFSNVYEVEHRTSPNAPMSRPPLWYRLRFDAVRRIKLPVEFKALAAIGDDPKMWDIQINNKQRAKNGRIIGTKFLQLDSSIKIEGVTYIIVKIDRKFDQNKQDVSTITLREDTTRDNPEEILMTVGQPTYTADQRVVLKDVFDPESEIVVRPGERFTLGNGSIGLEDYILKEFDTNKNVVVLLKPGMAGEKPAALDKDGRAMIVTSVSEIPEDSRVQKPAVAGTDSDNAAPGRK